jgi:hypothetical protein
MENIFSSFASKIYTHGKHVGYILKYKHLKPLCKKWSKNRQPDMTRVRDMYEYGGYIPKLIHLAELPEEGLVCYDGNHRREFLQMVDDGETDCIIDVMFNATTEEVVESFQTINKAVDVPEIYLEDSMNIKDDVLELVKKYETGYKSFVSKAAKCRSPNFNRDVLTDNITKIYRYLNGTKSIKEIGELLNILNTEYAKNKICRSHENYKDTIIQKCKKYDLWLFLEREIPCEHVERVARKKKFGIF